MSGVHRLLTRKDKRNNPKVNSPLLASDHTIWPFFGSLFKRHSGVGHANQDILPKGSEQGHKRRGSNRSSLFDLFHAQGGKSSLEQPRKRQRQQTVHSEDADVDLVADHCDFPKQQSSDEGNFGGIFVPAESRKKTDKEDERKVRHQDVHEKIHF